MHTIYRELGSERLPWDKQNKEWGSFLKGGIFFLSSSVSLPLVCAVVRQAGATTKAASSVDHSRNESVEMSSWESASYGRITEWVLRIVVEGKTIGPCAATRDTPSVCKQHLDLLIYLFIYSFIAAADLIQGFVYASRVLYCWAMALALDFETRMSLVDRKRKWPWKLWDPHTRGEWEQSVHWGQTGSRSRWWRNTASVALLTAGRTVAVASRNRLVISHLFHFELLLCKLYTSL